MKDYGIIRGLLVLALIVGLFSCGGGGGSGGGNNNSGLGLGGSGFGFFDTFGNTSSPATGDDFPKLWGVNLPIILYFNETIEPTSCNNLSINVVTIDDPLGQASYGAGHSAAVEYEVYGSELWIRPRIFFSSTEVTFGFFDDAVYEIKFQLPPSTNVVKSVSGRTITLRSSGKPVAFRTPAEDDPNGYIYDEVFGPPWAKKITLFDDQGAELAYWQKESISDPGTWYQGGVSVPQVDDIDPMEPPDIRVEFSEAVQPSTVVNVADKSSPSLSVLYYHGGNPTDPVKALGEWTLTQRVTGAGVVESFADFAFDLIAMRSDTEYSVNIKGIIDDLAGNQQGYQNSDEANFFTTVNTTPLADLVEEFDTTDYEDSSTTSADWGQNIGGDEYALLPGLGGGTGEDGPFLPPDFYPADAEININDHTIQLPTAKGGQVRFYNFTSFTLPEGWTLYPKDASSLGYPLVLKATGSVKIYGTINVVPVNGSQHGADGIYGQLQGTNGGVAIAGGGDGGDGGSINNGMPQPFQNVAGYESFHNNYGITGINTALSDYQLRDTNKSASEFILMKQLIDLGMELYLQPNVGTGPGNEVVVTNHTTFVVDSIDPATKVFNIVSDPLDPRYRGSMLQTSTNPGIPIPPIAKLNDAYLAGLIAGEDGVDPAGIGRYGEGSEPLSVAQTLLTYATAGGGGGGGGASAGADGETGPDYAPVGGAVGGFSTPDSLGGAGGLGAEPSGNVIGPSAGFPDTVLEVEDILGTADYSGFRVNPNVAEEGWLFGIVSNTNDSITILPITAGGGQNFDLDDVTFNGDEVFKVFPPEQYGGGGGGGSGVELTGTLKTSSSPPYQLPGWICGAGGGAGGGVLQIETARSVNVATSGRIYAEGGDGGTISGVSLSLPGGGGGAGGQMLIRAREDIKFSEDSVISVLGGTGGGFGIMGGDGGAGFIRLENAGNNLKPSSYVTTTFPPVDVMNLGIFPAQEGQSLAISKFYFMGISRPDFIYDPSNPDPALRGLRVVYDMTETDEFGGIIDEHTELDFPDPSGLFPIPPLFAISFNYAPADDNGFLDLSEVTNNFISYDNFNTMDGNPYLRFRILLRSSFEVNNGGNITIYKNLKIRSVSINRAQQ